MTPPGYERLLLGHAVAVARADLAASIRHALIGADGTRFTLHDYAARHPGARRLQGRPGGAAYAVTLPRSTERVVVRRNRHGGVFAKITRDRFLPPTRAPYELDTSRQLARLGISTPEVVAYATYPAGIVLRRADVCSREIPGGEDLAQIMMRDSGAARRRAFELAVRLVATLSRAGARHDDLNAKNILIASDSAYVLDVDRVTLGVVPDAALRANVERLGRSMRKWRQESGARISDREIHDVARDVHAAFSAA